MPVLHLPTAKCMPVTLICYGSWTNIFLGQAHGLVGCLSLSHDTRPSLMLVLLTLDMISNGEEGKSVIIFSVEHKFLKH
jgi:hypothetical protein